MNSERLERLRNIQSWTWYETLIMRPLAIVVLYPIADWKWLTPNLMTSAGNICKLLAAWLIAVREPGDVLLPFVLLQVGVLFDHIDGTLARYQRRWSALGSFYDKASDLVTWTVLVLAIAWVASEETGSVLPLLLAAISTNAEAAMGYSKWLARSETNALDWFLAKDDPSVLEQKTRPPQVTAPPKRDAVAWIRWFGRTMLNIFAFQEMDMYLWVGILLLLNQYMVALWALVAIHGFGAALMLAKRCYEMHQLDAELKKYR